VRCYGVGISTKPPRSSTKWQSLLLEIPKLPKFGCRSPTPVPISNDASMSVSATEYHPSQSATANGRGMMPF
jgi:hypothetical protein